MTTTPTVEDLHKEAFSTPATHCGELSNGASVLIDRLLLDTVSAYRRHITYARLISSAQRCIGAGCEPRVRPLPFQDGQGVSLAAPAAADQVEGTPTRVPPLPGHRPDCDCVSCEFPPRGSPRRGPVAPAPRHPFAAYLASCLRDCRNEMKTADVFDRMVIQRRMNDIRRASALYSDFLQECGN